MLQPLVENYCESHHMALLCEHMFQLITIDPVTMNLNEILKQPDRKEFIKAMQNDLQAHITRNH